MATPAYGPSGEDIAGLLAAAGRLTARGICRPDKGPCHFLVILVHTYRR
jgi:hypothetical protein